MNIAISTMSILVSILIGLLVSFIFNLSFVWDFVYKFTRYYLGFIFSIFVVNYILIKFNKIDQSKKIQAIVVGIFAVVVQSVIVLIVGLVNLILLVSRNSFNLDILLQQNNQGTSYLVELITSFLILLVINLFLSPLFAMILATFTPKRIATNNLTNNGDNQDKSN